MEPFVLEERPGGPALFFIRRWMDTDPGINAGFTSRRGGAGRAPFESLNCALHVQDDSETVIHNRRRIADTLHIPFDAWTCAEQVHGNEVLVATAEHRGRGRLAREDAAGEKDGLVTNVPGIWLTAFYADCVPLYFFDPVKRAVGLAHAGWKGTVANIAGETVRALRSAYGSDPRDIRAVVGPSIGGCCYEVGNAVVEPVERMMAEFALTNADDRCFRRKPGGKMLLNLREINGQLLAIAGILPMHIEITDRCTSCSTDLFFSYRKEVRRTGRMAAWIGLDLTKGAEAR